MMGSLFPAWSLLLYDGPTLNYVIDYVTEPEKEETTAGENPTTQTTETMDNETITTQTTTTKVTTTNTVETGGNAGTGGSGSGSDDEGSGGSRRRRSAESDGSGGNNRANVDTVVDTTTNQQTTSANNSTTPNTTLIMAPDSTEPTCNSYVFVDEPWYSDDFAQLLKSVLGFETPMEEDETRTVEAEECVRERPSPLHPNLIEYCTSLYMAYDCMAKNAFIMDQSISESVELTVHAVLQTVSQICRGKVFSCSFIVMMYAKFRAHTFQNICIVVILLITDNKMFAISAIIDNFCVVKCTCFPFLSCIFLISCKFTHIHSHTNKL